jgi:hypothetical protein
VAQFLDARFCRSTVHYSKASHTKLQNSTATTTPFHFFSRVFGRSNPILRSQDWTWPYRLQTNKIKSLNRQL